MISSKQDQRSAVGLVTGGSIRGPHIPLRARLANCSIIPRLMRGTIRAGWNQKQGGGRDNLWGMSGGSIAHIRMGWAECIHAFRPPPLRVSSVKSLALVDKAELTAVAKKLQCAMTTVFTLCIFAFLDYQS